MREDRLATDAKISIVPGDLFLQQQTLPAPDGRVIHFHDERVTELGQAIPPDKNSDGGDGSHRDRNGHLQLQCQQREEFELLRYGTSVGAGGCEHNLWGRVCGCNGSNYH